MAPTGSISRLRLLTLVACVVLIITSLRAQDPGADASETSATSHREVSAAEIAAAQTLGETLGIAEWLGPLAPVGLSPFFGITCLSGMSLWGKGWVSADNPLLGQHSPLNNSVVFFTFLVLTLVTSAPRLTKVSKPVAQALDQVEAWAGIITMIALKVILAAGHSEPAAEVQLGAMSLTVDALLIIAAAINILVINAVKFFFEVLIWITPVPAIDAAFEVANKLICGLLMAIYGVSPSAATALNLIILGASLLVFRWIYRRQLFFRTILVDALWSMIAPPKTVSTSGVTVFPVADFGPFAARTRCVLSKSEGGWVLRNPRWLRPDVIVELDDTRCSAEMRRGYFSNSIRLSGDNNVTLTFSRYYNNRLQELADTIGVSFGAVEAGAVAAPAGLKAELG